jgi:kynurenine formamidase
MARIVDLTLTLQSGMRGVEFEASHTLEKDGWNARILHLYSHCGTHMDAPVHFGLGAGTIDAFTLEQCIRPAWVVDLMGIPPRALIRVAHLGTIAEKVQSGEGLLLKTGWSARVSHPEYRTESPRVSLELAQWCVKRKIALLGVEPPSVADVGDREELAAVHRTLLEAGILVVEGLTNLGALSKERVTFFAVPLKIAEGDGSPIRAFAIEGRWDF